MEAKHFFQLKITARNIDPLYFEHAQGSRTLRKSAKVVTISLETQYRFLPFFKLALSIVFLMNS